MYRLSLCLLLMLVTMPLAAQRVSMGKTAQSSAGSLGTRQLRGEAIGGAEPGSRIGNRIQNRVQARLRNRIDRYYDPQANSALPFEIAGNQARAASRSGRR